MNESNEMKGKTGRLHVKHEALEQAAVGFTNYFQDGKSGHYFFLQIGKKIKRNELKSK
ncbi:MAG: hypothetical protein H6696_00910 [Deferribacteres bacterium]|nr:hypothetical protein [candidate division KSB1 bacterium]MCB9500467.1 hypothetical protein [Deferribacteres bacterium]